MKDVAFRPCHPAFSFRNSPNDATQSLSIISKPKCKPFVRHPLPIWSPLKPTPCMLWFPSIVRGPLPQLHRSPSVLRLSYTQPLLPLSSFERSFPQSYPSTSPSFHASKAPCLFPPRERPMVCRMAFFTLPPPC